LSGTAAADPAKPKRKLEKFFNFSKKRRLSDVDSNHSHSPNHSRESSRSDFRVKSDSRLALIQKESILRQKRDLASALVAKKAAIPPNFSYHWGDSRYRRRDAPFKSSNANSIAKLPARDFGDSSAEDGSMFRDPYFDWKTDEVGQTWYRRKSIGIKRKLDAAKTAELRNAVDKVQW
jgi:hypothetical protein